MIRPTTAQLRPLRDLLEELEDDRALDISIATASLDRTLVVSAREPERIVWLDAEGRKREL